MVGAGEFQTFLEGPDRGGDNYMLSCGDPTGTPENGHGIYSTSGQGAFCYGHWRDLHLRTLGFSSVINGVRPMISGVPVSMGGVRSGPRREMNNLDIEGFDTGIEAQSDHTRLDLVTSTKNFVGYHLGPTMTTLFGDNDLDHVFFDANTWAACQSTLPRFGTAW